MPRLLAGGPGLGVSADNAWIAVAGGGRLSLLDGLTRAESHAIHVTSGEIDVMFATTQGAPRIVTFQRRETMTDVRSYVVPTLEPAGHIELPGAMRPVAAVGDRLLALTETGEHPLMVTLAPKLLTADAIPLREPVQLAAEAPEGRLLVAARDQFECWDPIGRRAVFRLNLPITRPIKAGFAGRQRLLWVALPGPPANLEVYRFSDGRSLLRVDLGKRFVAGDGHADSARLVVAAKSDEGPIELIELDLALHERRMVTADAAVASYCVVEGALPAVVVADADARVRIFPLEKLPSSEGAEVERPRPARSATPPVAVRMQGGQSKRAPLIVPTAPDEGGPSWRARLGSVENRRASERREVGGFESGAVTVAAEGRTGSAMPPPVPEDADASRADRVTAQVPRVSLSEDGDGSDWRTGILAWSGSDAATALPEDDSPLGTLATRLRLSPAAAAALGLLYAAWLRGEGARGLSAATLAAAIGPSDAPTSEAAWQEALGVGALARAGLTRSRRGRVRLRCAVGRFLDGHPPRVARVHTDSTIPLRSAPSASPDGPSPIELDAGTFRVAIAGELALAAATLARHLGRDLALVDLTGPRVRRDLLEARLCGAVPLLLPNGRPPAEWLDLIPSLDGGLALIGVTGEVPSALAHLPELTAAPVLPG